MAGRAQLKGVAVNQLPDDKCHARVTLARRLGEHLTQTFVGDSVGEWSPFGELRTTAAAALLALERTFGAKAGMFVLQDLKTVESFDRPAVLVAIGVEYKKEQVRLVGFCEVKGDPREAAAKAALNATNRFVQYRLSD